MKLLGTAIQLLPPRLPLSETIPAIVREDLLTGTARLPQFFVLRGDTLNRWGLWRVSARERTRHAQDLGRGSDGVAMLGAIHGQPNTWALKVESPGETCTVLLVAKDGELLCRTVEG